MFVQKSKTKVFLFVVFIHLCADYVIPIIFPIILLYYTIFLILRTKQDLQLK